MYLLQKEGLDIKKLKLTINNLRDSDRSIKFYVDRNLNKNSKLLNKGKTYILNKFFFDQSHEVIFRSLTKIIQIIGKKYYPVRGKSVNELIKKIKGDVLYLDPPYNERQYSKNYFPLNIIAKTPEQLLTELPLKGKTGIPTDCFLSPFCKKGNSVENAFKFLFSGLKTKWIFLSYNSESIISKEKI